MLLDKEALCALIPHHADMCLLDAVQLYNDNSIVCFSRSHLDVTHPLRKNGKLHALIGIEYAAQTMAVHGALLGKDTVPRPGYLAGLRDVKLFAHTLDDTAADLRIEAERLMGDNNLLLYQFKLYAGSMEIISGRAAVVLISL